MSTLPTISVVIPCYNAAPWIAATLRSVAAQQWPAIEVIVVDDGSTDDSVATVKQQFPGVRLLQQHNAGAAAARNLGITESTGEWVAFLDADDIWLPGKLQAQWAAVRRQPEARLCYGAWQEWHSLQPEPSASLLDELAASAGDALRWSGPSGWIYPELLQRCEVWTGTVLLQRRLLQEVGLFDPGLRIGEDLDLWLRVSQTCPILRVHQPLALYRIHPASITKRTPDLNYQGLVIGRAIERWGYCSPDGRHAVKKQVDRALANTWCDFAGAQMIAARARRAHSASWAALRRDWSSLRAWQLLLKSSWQLVGHPARNR